ARHLRRRGRASSDRSKDEISRQTTGHSFTDKHFLQPVRERGLVMRQARRPTTGASPASHPSERPAWLANCADYSDFAGRVPAGFDGANATDGTRRATVADGTQRLTPSRGTIRENGKAIHEEIADCLRPRRSRPMTRSLMCATLAMTICASLGLAQEP